MHFGVCPPPIQKSGYSFIPQGLGRLNWTADRPFFFPLPSSSVTRTVKRHPD